MKIAAIIIGIDGYEKYTLPLVQSIRKHEPECNVVVIDNESKEPYPHPADLRVHSVRVPRMCYSQAINTGKSILDNADWYIVLSNDVLCTAPFAHILAEYDGNDLVGPLMKEVHGFPYLEGWCVCASAKAWQPWDERFLGSDYEDVAYSTAARQRGVGLVEDTDLPFVHLDQRQRFNIIEDFWGKNAHNHKLFMREYAGVKA